MTLHSSNESPTKDLILLAHGSPGGLSNGSGGGVYTQMEIANFAKSEWMSDNGGILMEAFLLRKGLTSKFNLERADKALNSEEFAKEYFLRASRIFFNLLFNNW